MDDVAIRASGLTKACTAQTAGQSFWYWRGGQSDADQDQTMALWKAGCDTGYFCPSPQPDKTKLAIKIKWHDSFLADTTIVVHNDLPYCQSIGMGDIGGVPSAECPLRPEGNDERRGCELWAADGPLIWSSDGEVVVKPDNDAMAGCLNCTWIQACMKSGVCSERLPVR